MGTIYKHKGRNARESRKNWVAQTRLNGRTKSRTFREKSEARRWLALVEGDIVSGRVPDRPIHEAPWDPHRGPIRIIDALALYSATAPQYLADNTWRHCQPPVIAYWREHAFANRPIANLYPNDIKIWIAQSQGQGRPSGTIRKRLNILRQAIDLALEHHASNQRNPTAGHRIKRDPKRRRRPTAAEKTALYTAARGCRGQLLYWVMCWAEECGMRRAEIAQLRYQDIDCSSGNPPEKQRRSKVEYSRHLTRGHSCKDIAIYR